MSPALTLLDDQQVTLHAAGGLDAAGNPSGVAPVSFSWSTSDASLFALTPSGSSCLVVTTGKLGAASVTCAATMPDGTILNGLVGITVTTDNPVSLGITNDPPASRLPAASSGGASPSSAPAAAAAGAT